MFGAGEFRAPRVMASGRMGLEAVTPFIPQDRKKTEGTSGLIRLVLKLNSFSYLWIFFHQSIKASD